MPDLNTITAKQLMRLIGTPDVPLIIDVRIDEDFDADPRLIPTAFRHSHHEIAELIKRVAGRKCVVICHKGLKLSHGTAALLRAAGVAAEVLKGGFEEWLSDGFPLLPIAGFPTNTHVGQRWVSRHRPKIDRIACPWLIRRFIDPQATFMFVPPSEVVAVAERFSATPYDIENVRFSHRGDQCTFDALIADFGLTHPALDRLARLVRAADTNRHQDSPEAAGLLAVSVGLSRMFKDDHQQLEAGMTVYDALYRWARDGYDEGHDWPAGRTI